MAERKTYVELLKDPRWQRRRLEVLSRDDWTCMACFSRTETLHVHHLRYLRGRPPWESPLEDLQTLCETCHEMASNATKYIRERVDALSGDESRLLVGILRALEMTTNHDLDSIGPLGPVDCYPLAVIFGLSPHAVGQEIFKSPTFTVTGHRLWEMRREAMSREK